MEGRRWSSRLWWSRRGVRRGYGGTNLGDGCSHDILPDLQRWKKWLTPSVLIFFTGVLFFGFSRNMLLVCAFFCASFCHFC